MWEWAETQGITGHLFFGKTDAVSTFHLLPMQPGDRCYLVLKATHPVTKELFYFVDKCLPFGASISWALFQKFSDALAYITEKKLSFWMVITNYLDNFLFIAYTIALCKEAMEQFMVVCSRVGCPISKEKTEWPCECLVFLGMLMNGRTLTLSILNDKAAQAICALKSTMSKKKATIHDIQKLMGLLNFLSKAVIPGWTFTRNMYDKLQMTDKHGKPLKQYHHVKVDQQFKLDCSMWISFLEDAKDTVLCHPFTDLEAFHFTKDLSFWTDASLNPLLGFGGVFGTSWICGHWVEHFIRQQ